MDGSVALVLALVGTEFQTSLAHRELTWQDSLFPIGAYGQDVLAISLATPRSPTKPPPLQRSDVWSLPTAVTPFLVVTWESLGYILVSASIGLHFRARGWLSWND